MQNPIHRPKNQRFTRFKQNLRALQYRNYRLYFFGQGLSLIGTWMTQIASIWLIYQFTNSPFLLGVIGFVSLSPNLILPPIAGVLSDRWNRRRILLTTQSLALLRSLTLAILAFRGDIDAWHLIFLCCVQGILTGIDLPIRQAFVSEIVTTKQDLGNAIALNSSLVSSARLLGPAIASILLSLVGASFCFLIDACSYIAVLAALLAMNLPKTQRQLPEAKSSPWQEIRSGFTYTLYSQPIRTVLLLLASTNFLGTPFIALGPIFANDVLGGDSDTFGYLMTASAVGALLGALYLSSQVNLQDVAKLMLRAPIGLGIGLILFSQSRILGLSLIFITTIGLMLVIQIAASNTFIQTIVDNSKRGRVMSFYTLTSEAGIPFGNLFAGFLASILGVQTTLAIEGGLCLLAAYYFSKFLPDLQRAISAAD